MIITDKEQYEPHDAERFGQCQLCEKRLNWDINTNLSGHTTYSAYCCGLYYYLQPSTRVVATVETLGG